MCVGLVSSFELLPRWSWRPAIRQLCATDVLCTISATHGFHCAFVASGLAVAVWIEPLRDVTRTPPTGVDVCCFWLPIVAARVLGSVVGDRVVDCVA